MLNVCFVCWLMNVFAVSNWLQYRGLVPDKRGVYFPVPEGILNFLTLPFLIHVILITSLDFCSS